MGEIWARYGADMGEIWARYGRDMGEIWARYGRDMGEIWARHGGMTTLARLMPLSRSRRLITYMEGAGDVGR